MIDYSNNVISCSISYRRNIKDMPFVKTLTDNELAIGVSRSMNEIFGDEFEFKSLKNLPLKACLKLIEEGIFTNELVDNKDISAYGITEDKSKIIFVNEQDHIRVESRFGGFNLEKCFKLSNEMDDKILNKLEMCFDVNLGYLSSNPNLVGTGMEIKVNLFIPAIVKNGKIQKIKKELLKDEFEIYSFSGNDWDNVSPFLTIKNKYTFGFKENEFAEKMQTIITKICELENIEESNLFEISSSGLVDEIYRSMGILQNCYRLTFAEAEQKFGEILWGINLKMLKCKKGAEIIDFLTSIKDNHFKDSLSVKEQEKARARLTNKFIFDNISKGEVDV